MRDMIFGLLFVLVALPILGQTQVVGTIIDDFIERALPEVWVSLENSTISIQTNTQGVFILSENLPLGEQILVLSKQGYVTRRMPIIINEGTRLEMGTLSLSVDEIEEQHNSRLITLNDSDLNGDNNESANVSGLLSAGRDVFSSAASFDWSATFFRPRGFDSADGKVLINGIAMNKQLSGRPQWANWGGLNDVQRNREVTQGLKASEYSFGGLGGVTNFIMRASQERKGGRVSYATANRSYEGRIMGSYHTGLSTKGWAFSILASRRFGNQGFVEGTLYDANSFYASIEKKINEKHSLNFTGFYAPNRRGRSTAITQEVFDLKGRTYNPLWGFLNGEQRNTRIREVKEPVIMLNHYWNVSEKTTVNTNLAYQTGTIKNSRIDNGRLRNPAPDYYQLLPSFALQDENPTANDFQNAFLLQQDFVNDGQFDWEQAYESNINSSGPVSLGNIVLQNDVIEDTQLTANVIVNSQLTENITLNGNLNYKDLSSENYAEIEDLLGAQGFLDIDNFAVSESQDGQSGTAAQSDIRNPNRVVIEGDRYKYNYEIDATVVSGFLQSQFVYRKADFYVSTFFSTTTYQRNGLFENGNFPNDTESAGSFGLSEELSFTNGGAKGGLTYKVTGRHLIDFNGAIFSRAPGIRNSFSNARQNNDVVFDLESENIQSADLSYIFRAPLVKVRFSGFYTGFKNGTDIGFYFTENNLVGGEGAFVQEVLTNVARKNVGLELGVEAQVLPSLKLKVAASVGQFTYDNNPDLYLTSDDFEGRIRFGDGTTALKNLHVAGGPERAYQIGFEYRDPEFWNFSFTTNYFSNAYVDVSNLKRSANFLQDEDGQLFNDFNQETANDLLRQQQLDDYFLVNVTGGKSWRVGGNYIGFFATINNVLDQEYVTGGFEQSRRVNYRSSLEEGQRNNPLFGNRFFFGNGTTYYVNAYLRF